jgi:hypothetical protein
VIVILFRCLLSELTDSFLFSKIGFIFSTVHAWTTYAIDSLSGHQLICVRFDSEKEYLTFQGTGHCKMSGLFPRSLRICANGPLDSGIFFGFWLVIRFQPVKLNHYRITFELFLFFCVFFFLGF